MKHLLGFTLAVAFGLFVLGTGVLTALVPWLDAIMKGLDAFSKFAG